MIMDFFKENLARVTRTCMEIHSSRQIHKYSRDNGTLTGTYPKSYVFDRYHQQEYLTVALYSINNEDTRQASVCDDEGEAASQAVLWTRVLISFYYWGGGRGRSDYKSSDFAQIPAYHSNFVQDPIPSGNKI